MFNKLTALEKQSNRNTQYARKESAELHSVPTNIPDKQLEGMVLSMLNDIKPPEEPAYTSTDIYACHRLRKREQVIIKFTHHKHMCAVMNRRSLLK